MQMGIKRNWEGSNIYIRKIDFKIVLGAGRILHNDQGINPKEYIAI